MDYDPYLPADVFKFDPQYIENEDRYKSIKAEILGEDGDDESGSGSEEEDSEEDEGKYLFFVSLISYVQLLAIFFQLQKQKKVLKTERKRIWSIYVVSFT